MSKPNSLPYEEAVKCLTYNADTGEIKLKNYTESVNPDKFSYTELSQMGYLRVRINKKRYRAHRIAWLLFYGEEPKGIVDHINGNKLDNRICNLRIADDFTSSWNKGLSKRNTSGYKNVFYDSTEKKWAAAIIAKKKLYKKHFNSVDDAIKVAADLRCKLHGEYANHGKWEAPQ
jgi:hypothetical protein